MRLVVVFTLVMMASNVHSQILLGYYETDRNSDAMKLYIAGSGSGYLWANVKLKSKGIKELFCTPKKLKLRIDDYISILETELKDKYNIYKKKNAPISLILLNGLIKTYPCH